MTVIADDRDADRRRRDAGALAARAVTGPGGPLRAARAPPRAAAHHVVVGADRRRRRRRRRARSLQPLREPVTPR